MMNAVKACVNGLFLAIAFPVAAVSGFGRVTQVFRFGAQMFALVPGLPGDYGRIAYYRLTLRRCSLESRISFGSFFAHPEVVIGEKVYIGAYCILGRCTIGDRTQIASQVQILSGRRQHKRETDGRISGAENGELEHVDIGEDCWIGAGSIIMASIGPNTTIGSGAVVVHSIPAHTVAVGNPARTIREQEKCQK